MKKIIIIVLLCISLICTGCTLKTADYEETNNGSMFVIVEETMLWKVVYHKDTKVMYSVSKGYTSGVFTLLVDSDGTPMVWKY